MYRFCGYGLSWCCMGFSVCCRPKAADAKKKGLKVCHGSPLLPKQTALTMGEKALQGHCLPLLLPSRSHPTTHAFTSKHALCFSFKCYLPTTHAFTSRHALLLLFGQEEPEEAARAGNEKSDEILMGIAPLPPCMLSQQGTLALWTGGDRRGCAGRQQEV